MKRIIALLCGAILIGTLSACAGGGPGSTSPSTDNKPVLSQLKDSDFNTSGDVVIKTEKDVYDNGTAEITYTIQNTTSKELTYGLPYTVEAWLGGQWYQVPFPKNTAWDAIGVVLKANETNTASFKFSALDYKMTDGRYRLVKEIDGKKYSAEFQIGSISLTADTPFGYQALEKLPKEYPGETAKANGDFVVTPDSLENNGKLADFVYKVSLGLPAMVRITQYSDLGFPTITDYVYNLNQSGYYQFRHDDSRSSPDTNGIKDMIFSYLITDGKSLFLSNCASMDLIRSYPNAGFVRMGYNVSLGDIADLIRLVETISKERLEGSTARLRVYAPDGLSNVALNGGLSYTHTTASSSETKEVKDPNDIAMLISDAYWLDDTTFVLVCGTKSGLIYYDIIGNDAYQSGYGKSATIQNGLFYILN